jgi:3-methylcrotonyl-CoA carboxylase alpha subunit
LVIDGQSFESKMFSVEPVERGLVKRVDIEVNQHRFRALCVVRDNEVFVHSDTIGALNFTLGSVGQSVVEELSSDVISSPMPAKIIAISVSVGDQVIKGQVLLVLESMKMETSIVANRDGVIAGVNISEGELVEAYTTLIELAEEK